MTLTTDFGKILEGIHRTKIRGSMHLATGIQIAGVGPWIYYQKLLETHSDRDLI